MQPFLAMIIPVSSGGGGGYYPDQGLPGAPPGYWGGVAPPYPDQGLPGWQPRPSHPIAPGGGGGVGVWPSPGHPAHPIAPGGPGLGFWGGVAPPYPDQGLPGGQPGPSHPIYFPPGTGPTPPPDGTGNHPAHPIVVPPDVPPDPAKGHVLIGAFVPGSEKGVVWFYVEVPSSPTTPTPKPA